MNPPSLMQVPTYATSLIGRASDVAALTVIVQNRAERLVTLVGASGSGKTRLALEVAAAVAPAFPDGVVFVALTPVQDSRFLLAAIATHLQIQEQGLEPLLTTLSTFLSDKHMLLILDNMEQVRAASSEIAHLCAAAPHLTVLVTSQITLDLPMETVYTVPPLTIPTDDSMHSPAAVLEYPAVALFVERLRTVQPRFHLTPSSTKAVVHICQLLDGYPLAIELVAAHSTRLAPEDILLLLRNHLGVRSHQARVQFSSRTAILHPVLDWCASRLPMMGKHLLLRLGVFQGGWTAAAAQSVLAPEYDIETVAEALALLVQKHLVLVETLPGRDPRYEVLDAIRDYSVTRLGRQGRDGAVRGRHARYFAELATEADGALRGPEQEVWLRQLDAEIHNLRSAMIWGLEHRDPGLTLTIGANLYLFWSIRAWYSEGRSWLGQTLPKAETAPAEERAKAWKALGVLMLRQGAYTESLVVYEESLRLYAAVGDTEGQAAVLNNIGIAHSDQGRYAVAQQAYEQGFALLRTSTEPNGWLMSTITHNLGALCEEQGYYTDAWQWHAESLSIWRQLGDQAHIAMSLLSLGNLAHKYGDLNSAQVFLSDSVAISGQLGDQRTIASCWWILGNVAVDQELYGDAERLYRMALDLFAAVGNQHDQAGVYLSLGNLTLLLAQWNEAAHYLSLSFTLATVVGAQDILLQIELQRSRLALAQNASTTAWAILQSLGPKILAADSNRALVIQTAELAALVLGHTSATHPTAIRLWQQSQVARKAWSIPMLPSLLRWSSHYGSIGIGPRADIAVDTEDITLATTLEYVLQNTMLTDNYDVRGS